MNYQNDCFFKLLSQNSSLLEFNLCAMIIFSLLSHPLSISYDYALLTLDQGSMSSRDREFSLFFVELKGGTYSRTSA